MLERRERPRIPYVFRASLLLVVGTVLTIVAGDAVAPPVVNTSSSPTPERPSPTPTPEAKPTLIPAPTLEAVYINSPRKRREIIVGESYK